MAEMAKSDDHMQKVALDAFPFLCFCGTMRRTLAVVLRGCILMDV